MIKNERMLIYTLLDGAVFFIFMLGGILFLFGWTESGRNDAKSEQMKKCTEPSEAVISRVSEEERYDTDQERYETVYHLTYNYSVGGKYYEKSYTSHTSAEVGDRLEIMYDPDDPALNFLKHDIDSMPIRKGTSRFFMNAGKVLSGIGLLAALVLLISRARYNAKKKRERQQELYEAERRYRERNGLL